MLAEPLSSGEPRLKPADPEHEREPYSIKESQVILLNLKVHGSRHVGENIFLLITMKSPCSIENQRQYTSIQWFVCYGLKSKSAKLSEGANLARVTIALLALSKETPSRTCWKRPSKKKI